MSGWTNTSNSTIRFVTFETHLLFNTTLFVFRLRQCSLKFRQKTFLSLKCIDVLCILGPNPGINKFVVYKLSDWLFLIFKQSEYFRISAV